MSCKSYVVVVFFLFFCVNLKYISFRFGYDSSVSSAKLLENELKEYHICKFENVCISSHKTFIYIPSNFSFYNQKFKQCCIEKGKCSDFDKRICKCATKRSLIEFVKIKPGISFKNGNSWLINFWDRSKKNNNPSHFAMKIVSSAVIFNLAKKSVPAYFHQAVFQDRISHSFSEFEFDFLTFLNMSKRKYQKIDFIRENQIVCYKSVYTSQILQTFADKPEDLDSFRTLISNITNISILRRKTLTETKALILLRKNGAGLRRFVNLQHMKFILKKYNVSYDEKYVSRENSTKDQANTFNSYSIIISPHSSQLTNLLFSKIGTVVIIITPYFVDDCFYNLGRNCRLNVIHSKGHRYFNSSTKSFLPKLNIGKQYIGRTKHWNYNESYGNDIFVNMQIFEENIKTALKILKQQHPQKR